ncbi:hypothetical protein AWZ03_002352 [Drosophila navojoa]|uniref:Reverse transcriptase domain-containing protein n=1 Tax=Drosophila navojoa TaxID=7232 RepID=A0A484BTR4_DRONA|nr:hypothetical protein AWZ03_002352 [Drosophila navojoa]
MHEIAAIENNAEQSNDAISTNTSNSSSGLARNTENKTPSFAVGSFSLVKSQRKPLPRKRKGIASSHDSPTSSNPKRSTQSTSQKPFQENPYRNRFEVLSSDSDNEDDDAMSTMSTEPINSSVSLSKVLEQCTANHRKQQDKLNASAQSQANVKQPQSTPKSNIPPITIPRLTNLPMLQDLLKNNKLYGPNKVAIRTSAGGLTRLYAQDIETFRSIQNLFENVKLEFYTYQLKQERPYKFVIKGLHHSTLHSAIKNELGSLGFNIIATGSPTRFPDHNRQRPSCLDFGLYKDIPQWKLKIAAHNDLGSDHMPLVISLDAAVKCYPQAERLINRNVDINLFKLILNNKFHPELELHSEQDIDDALKLFNENIRCAAKEAEKTRSSHAPRQAGSLVLTSELRYLLQQKRRLRRIYQRTLHPLDKSNWCRAANTLRSELARQRAQMFDDMLENMSTAKDAKFSLWKASRNCRRQVMRQAPIKNGPDSWCRSDEEQAEALASHLEARFLPYTLASQEDTQSTEQALLTPLQLDPPEEPYNFDEVASIIKHLNPNKAPGHDNICNRTLRALPENAILVMVIIFNAITRLQYFPAVWKTALVVMIHKTGKPEEDPASYRPISLLPSLSKVWERLVIRRLVAVTETRKLIPPQQFGFRAGHGTTEQLHRVTDHILRAFDNKKHCNAIFLDIEQAFDRVWHPGLLQKIKEQLPSHYFALIRSYLEGRSFRVKVKSSQSSTYSIAAGVPQGSILAPLLFCIFIGDAPLPDASGSGVSSNSTLVATYADDICVLVSTKSSSTAAVILQDFIDSFVQWANRWNIKISATKSKSLCFSLRREAPATVFINGTPLEKARTVKYLGIHLDSRLTFKPHILATVGTCRARLKQMSWLLHNKSKLSLANKRMLIIHTITPIWRYGVQVWGVATKSNRQKIQSMQNKALRQITGCPWFVRNSSLHRDLKMDSVEEQISFHSSRYNDRLKSHANRLARKLPNSKPIRRLKRRQFENLIANSN